MATSGFFSFSASHHYSYPIPYNADVALFKYILESMPHIDDIYILSNNLNLCGSSSYTRTEFVLTYHNVIKSSPVVFVTSQTSASRYWNNSTQPLISQSSTPILRFRTEYILTCPICTTCSGSISFRYGDSISNSVSVTVTNANHLVLNAINSLSKLLLDWPLATIDVAVTNSNNINQICNSNSIATVTITLLSNYAITMNNIYLIDDSNAGLTFHSNIVKPNRYECSNQGVCDRSIGICNCFQYDGLVIKSSDGLGSIGLLGDCGYIQKNTLNCLSSYNSCSEHGVCDISTGLCQCQTGWKG